MFKLSSEEEKKIFQNAYGKSISLRTWYRYKKMLIASKFPITVENLQTLAKFKKSLPHSNNAEDLATYLKLVKIIGETSTHFTRKSFLELIENKLGISFHHSTVSGWFKPIGGSANTVYQFADLLPITLKAFKIARKIEKPEI
jgi:hypothetical protein